MYRLMIADDERLEREGLEWIITNMMPDTFHFIQAENGRAAIELAEEHRPHVIIMDVHMPGIQGLDAIREIKQRVPDAKFVLVTAYDEFAYAQEAVTLGVKEYIVKPADREHVVRTLQRLTDEIQEEKQKRNEELELRDRVSQLAPLAESELAFMLMVDQIRETDTKQLSEWLDFPLDHGCAVVIAFPEHDYALNKKKIYERIKSFAKTHQLRSVVSSLIDRHVAIFIRKPGETPEDRWSDDVRRYAEKLAGLSERQLDRSVSLGIGALHSGAEGLRRSYFEAVFSSTCCGDSGGICSFDKLTAARGGPVSLPQGAQGFEDNARQSYVLAALQRIREEREEQTFTVLDKAKQYIGDNFTEELSLEEVASFVHLNPHYFSKVFKQQVGETFIDYVTALRIDKAKELMLSDMSLKEVCFTVGYKDPNYFSRVFKRVTGVTPTEFRNGSKASE